jgi:hypothetical protein
VAPVKPRRLWPAARAGLGAGTAPANATNVVATDGGLMLKRTFTITAPGAVSAFTCTHNLNTTLVAIQAQDASGNAVEVDWQATNANTVVVTILPAPVNTTVFNITIWG